MLERRKSFNSSLHNISKKRLAEMQAGTYTPKRQKPIKTISTKARKRIKDYRAACFERWGYRCFLCGRIDETGKTLDCHHCMLRINGDNTDTIFPLCNRYSGCKGHNHTGKDKKFWEINDAIIAKLSEKQKKVFENQWANIYNIDYDTSKELWYERNMENYTV